MRGASSARARAARGALAVALLGSLCAACAAPSLPARRGDGDVVGEAAPFRLASVVDQGDAARRAALRLVLDGLDLDAAGRHAPALRSYERALQVDPTSPYAYLALARHHVARGRPAQALAFVDKTEALLRVQSEWNPGLEAHLSGLRGAALRSLGRAQQAAPLLARARDLAPAAWGDGELGPEELR